MTATTTGSARNPGWVTCPTAGCTYTMPNAGSVPAHLAMAHPEVPMDAIAPKRRLVDMNALPEIEHDADCPDGAHAHVFTPAAPADPPTVGAASLLDLPLDLVDVGDNVRVEIEGLEELAASIAEHGVLQPIKATGPHADGRYLVTWGQRRTVASRLAGRSSIPAIVLPPDADVDRHGSARSIEQLVENLHRADLNPIDAAVAMRAVVDAGTSQADLARKLGIAPSTVSNSLRLLTLDAGVREKIRGGEITASHGKAIAALPVKQQAEIAKDIVAGRLSSHQLESSLRWKQDTAKNEAEIAKRTAKWIPKIAAAFEAYLLAKGALVSIGYTQTLDTKAIAPAVKAAGYTPTEEYAYAFDKPAKGFCDCTITRLSFERTWKVSPGCIDRGHQGMAQKLDRAAEDAARAAYDARLALVRGALEHELRFVEMSPAALRLLWAATQNYSTSKTPDDYPAAIAAAVTGTWRVREMATPELLAELGIEVPA